MKLKNWVVYKAIPWFTSLGFTARTVTLQVPGRRSGKPIQTSLSLTEFDHEQYLVSLEGTSLSKQT